MGTVKHRDKVLNFLKETPVAKISSLKKIIGEKSTYVYLLLNKMVAQKKIYRLTKGMYSLYDDPTLIVFCFKPAYLGLQEALSVHNIWEQETNVIILTTKTVREGIRNSLSSNILLRRLPKELFFGVEYKKYGDFYVPVSDIEKTFLDFVYFKQHLDKETLPRFRKKINYKKLKQYLKYYPENVSSETLRLLNKKG